MYNKAEIMKQAWNWFADSNVWLSDIEWASYTDKEKTFSVCLKAAWSKAKEEVKEVEKEIKHISKSEELKAWNWAERKLGLHFNISDDEKFTSVKDETKINFGLSVWACAMKAVKLHNDLFPQTAA
ncbi:transaldolase [Listeria monocytogenes]|nr:transaldolase [Listeria monocytogenes]EKZ4356880.1 anti-CRISPR protein AcrIIA3 [Listeria monocytogenes]